MSKEIREINLDHCKQKEKRHNFEKSFDKNFERHFTKELTYANEEFCTKANEKIDK